MTKKEFKSSEPLRVALAVALEDPALKEALAILRDEATPSKSKMPPMMAGVHYDTTLAHQLHEFAGIQSVLTKLKDLTVPYGAKEVDDEQEFEHMLPDILKRKQ